jgi:diguanylate cyclase (GGDEF)-like protein
MKNTYEKLEYITQNRQPLILCINNNDKSLQYLKEELSMNFCPTYSIIQANDEAEALEIVQIANELIIDIAVVVSEYDLVSSNEDKDGKENIFGDEMLAQIHKLSPITKTILIVDKENTTAIKNAIEHANLYQYIDKPIETIDIKLTIINAINYYENEKTISEHNYMLQDIKNRTKELKESNQRLYLLAATDPLTGINNRRSFYEFAVKEYATAIRYNDLLSVGIINIDNFEEINDKYGRTKADEVLQSIAKSTNQILRISDTLGRINGDEFAFLLPHTAIDGAKVAGMKICQNIRDSVINDDNDKPIKATVSIGISELHHGSDEQIKKLMQRAQDALFEAKKNGKDRVEIFN